MSIGKGIAIAGIWLGVGIAAFGAPADVPIINTVTTGAVIATVIVVLN